MADTQEKETDKEENTVILDVKAGARHNRFDIGDIQELHDVACRLGAACPDDCITKSADGEGELLTDKVKRERKERKSLEDLGLRQQEYFIAAQWETLIDSQGSGVTVTMERGLYDLDIVRVTNNAVIVQDWESEQYFRYPYTVDESDQITFGAPQQVEARFSFEPVEETEEKAQIDIDPETVNAAIESEGNELKSIATTDDFWAVGNHIILWGDPEHTDLEGHMSTRTNPDGTMGEYFTKGVQWQSEFTERGYIDVDCEHGRDPDPNAPKRNDILGQVDMKSARETDLGLWAIRLLDRQNEYVQALRVLSDNGLIRLGSSTEPVQGKTVKTDDGGIQVWPLFRDSITVTPMEHRMIVTNNLTEIKSSIQTLGEILPDLTELEIEEEAEYVEDETAIETAGAVAEEVKGLTRDAEILELTIQLDNI